MVADLEHVAAKILREQLRLHPGRRITGQQETRTPNVNTKDDRVVIRRRANREVRWRPEKPDAAVRERERLSKLGELNRDLRLGHALAPSLGRPSGHRKVWLEYACDGERSDERSQAGDVVGIEMGRYDQFKSSISRRHVTAQLASEVQRRSAVHHDIDGSIAQVQAVTLANVEERHGNVRRRRMKPGGRRDHKRQAERDRRQG